MIPEYALKLGLKVCSINIGAKKIDSFIIKIFEIILASFQVENKLGRAQFFKEAFLFSDFNIKVILTMLFLIFNNADIKFY